MKIIVAIGHDNVIGRKGDLIWHIKEDLKNFKALTTGNVVLMGRKTWESLPKRPLPGRQNIVLTRQKGYSAENADVANSIDEALQIAAPGKDVFVIGGAEIYKLALDSGKVDELVITEIDADAPDADTFFPPLTGLSLKEASEWKETDKGTRYRYATYLTKE